MDVAKRVEQIQADDMRAEKLARQYRDLFGKVPGPGESDARSEAQIAVWADLAKAGYDDQPTFVLVNGALCPLRAAKTDGRRSLWLYIKSQVNLVPQIKPQ